MVDILRVKPCDIHWDRDIKDDELAKELFDKYESVLSEEVSIDELSVIQLNDFARLQLLVLLGLDTVYDEYVTISFDEIHKIGLIKVSDIETDDFLLDEEDNTDKYFPIEKILLNNSLDDPLIHYDTIRNILSLPSKILLENDGYKNAFGITDNYSFRESENKLDGLLSYNEEYSVYQYDLDESIDSNKYFKYQSGWNYAATQDLDANDDGYYVYSEDGETVGRIFDIIDLDLDSILVADTDDTNSDICLGADLSVDKIFNLEGDSSFALVYVDKPTDSFALAFSNKNEETSTFLKISIKFGDFGNVTDSCVYCLNNCCLYIPIRIMSIDIIQLLYRLGYGWDENDLHSIGFEPAIELTPEYKEYILEKAFILSVEEGSLVALNSIFKMLEKETNISKKTINYELIIEDLTQEFYKKKKSSNEFVSCFIDEEGNIDESELVEQIDENFDDIDDEFKINF